MWMYRQSVEKGPDESGSKTDYPYRRWRVRRSRNSASSADAAVLRGRENVDRDAGRYYSRASRSPAFHVIVADGAADGDREVDLGHGPALTVAVSERTVDHRRAVWPVVVRLCLGTLYFAAIALTFAFILLPIVAIFL